MTTNSFDQHSQATPNGQLVKFAAGLAVLGVEVRSFGPSWLTYGLMLAIIMLPLLLRSYRRFNGCRVVGVTAVLCIISVVAGAALAQSSLADDPGRQVTEFRVLYEIGTLFQIVATAIFIVWAVRLLRVEVVLALWAVGSAMNVILYDSLFYVNPWKYGLALPISILALVAVGRRGPLGVFTFALLLTVSAVFAHRSWLVVLLISVVLLLLVRPLRKRSTAARLAAAGTISVVLAIAIYQAALDGALGGSIQERTERQLDWGQGNIILGGRAEWGAALSLASERPVGFGLGVSASGTDWGVALAGLRMPEPLRPLSVVAEYMRAGTIEFHSVAWNFWSHYGIAGVVLAGWLIVVASLLAIRGAQATISNRVRNALVVFAVAGLWNLLFSPPSFAQLGIIVGLLGTCLYSPAGRKDGNNANGRYAGRKRRNSYQERLVQS